MYTVIAEVVRESREHRGDLRAKAESDDSAMPVTLALLAQLPHTTAHLRPGDFVHMAGSAAIRLEEETQPGMWQGSRLPWDRTHEMRWSARYISSSDSKILAWED